MKDSTPFGQLPILDLGNGTIFAQSDAMLRHAAGKLMPADPLEQFVVNEVLGLSGDFEREWTPCLYIGMKPEVFGYPSEDFSGTDEHKEIVKRLRQNFINNTLGKYMNYFEKYLIKSSNQYLCGNEPTIADCSVVPQLRKYQGGFIDHVDATCLDKYPFICDYIERFMAIPEVKAYYDAQKK